MMDFISGFITDKGSELISTLIDLGFSQDQAEQFLPEAGKNVMSLIGEGQTDIDSILDNINISALAEKIGIDSSLVSNGLKSILPTLLEKLGSKGVGGLLG